MKKLMSLGAGLLLVASAGFASNTGFKLNYPLPQIPAPASNNYLMSFPSFYYPNGNVSTTTPQNSIDLCFDLNDIPSGGTMPSTPPKVASVVNWQLAADNFFVFSCTATKAPFNILPGIAYAAIPSGPGVVVNVVGSNDDNLTSNKGTQTTPLMVRPPPNSNNNWISFPYHQTASNSIDACTELNALTTNKIAGIFRFDPVRDNYATYTCGAGTKGMFNLVPGEGYIVVPSADTAIAFDVY